VTTGRATLRRPARSGRGGYPAEAATFLAMADRRAADMGMPSTEAFLTADMLP
jgi:hypothetical protein